jgi:hypothetical protein
LTGAPLLPNASDATLARIIAELDAGNVYHSPERVMIEVANFIGRVQQHDVLATSDTIWLQRSKMISFGF